jgi:hypothetical protein
MSFLFLTVDSITVHDAGEGGFWPFDTDAEWMVDISAASDAFNYSTSWSNDSVDDGDSFHIGASWFFMVNPGENIRISVNGEEDDNFLRGGDDPLPGVTDLVLNPANIGQDYNLHLTNGDYSYTVNFDATVFG